MPKSHKIDDQLKFIVRSNKNKISATIKPNNIYIKWLRFLKNRKEYSRYQSVVIRYLHHKKIGYWWGYTAFLNPGTMNGLKEIINHFDDFAHDYSYSKYPLGYWKSLLVDFEIEENEKERKSLLTRKLYHMDTPKVVHHQYIGSTYLRKRLIDKIIDRLLFIKRK